MTELFGGSDGSAVADATALHRLHARLVTTAADEGLLDVAYRTVDSPFGPLLLAATDVGLVRVAFDAAVTGVGFDLVLGSLADRVSPRVLHAPARLDQVARELDEYFAGRRRVFEVPVDLRLAAGFRRAVLGHLPDVRFGSVATYGAVAVLAGHPRAVRAVGTACATNPVPIVVPCHRVVRADGALGGYLGGPDAKRELLALEGVLER
ncbi:MAG: methylated-DNA--[protein]-cysteine S-methyltransferase [Nakamurella sp.]